MAIALTVMAVTMIMAMLEWHYLLVMVIVMVVIGVEEMVVLIDMITAMMGMLTGE